MPILSLSRAALAVAFTFGLTGLTGSMEARAQIEERCADAMTMREMTRCIQDEHEDANDDVQRAYENLHARLSREQEAADVTRLEDAQRRWEDYRTAQCRSERAFNNGGSMADMSYYACMNRLARERTRDLESMLHQFEAPEGLGIVESPPGR